ncbi:glycosyl transferase family 39 [Rippkaea orientalis PCC 8801]|uniref:Glycosyl transferase family 39 n=1 Tax=Rippkaea orientalis (strain PCC 8801 / RF-1) TaxID=41431 RepID=B7JYC3_RIPO1|nr:glycosyltransferase family 39 protein [Rippkaea orientalis]ACK67225.1 glycosyl transferase family 39 [Rippkaea orientalis PCC 8801]
MIKNLKIQNYSQVYLLVILIFALLVRVIFLGTIPNGFFTDEASYAYDSYSILHTLRDQYGKFLPWYFKSANDYREGLYMYLMIPFIKIFGLNPFGARITSAVIGTLTVFVLYHLAKEIFNQKVGLLSALFLAITPWHIHFSRITFRANLVPLLFCLSLLFFVKSFKEPKWLILSSPLFGISIYTYNSARVFVPLFLLGLVIIYRKHLWNNKQISIISLLLFLIIFIPQLIYQISPEGMARADAVGLQSNLGEILKNYWSYFSPEFLFIKGDPVPRHTIDKMGHLYSFQIILLILGIIGLITHQVQTKAILFLWLFLYPIPAALVSPSSAVRTLAGIPVFAMISAYGITTLLDWIKGKLKATLIFAIILIIFANITIYLHRYVTEYPRWNNIVWLTTLDKVIHYADSSPYQCLIYSSNAYGKYAYIMIPFYTKFPPAEYQKLGIDVVEDKLDMGRWKVVDLEKSANLNTDCLYLLYRERNVPREQDKDTRILEQKGYTEKIIYSPTDLNNYSYYRLVEIEKKN